MKNTGPFILVIDDDPDSTHSELELGFADLTDRASFEVLHPRDVEISNLEQADLVLVDYRLDSWPERDAQESIGLKPVTGMALAVILREHVDRSNKDRLTAFALHSAHLAEVSGRLPAASAQHVVARLNNLEWAFLKTESSRYHQMVLLAEAIRQLPRQWPDGEEDSASRLKSLLGMSEENPWFDRCWREVQECRPPVHDLRGGAHGILLIRWLLHQVIPYPTFLWADHWVAARLRIPIKDFRTVLKDENSQLFEELKSMQYSGVLTGFLGNRWWRGALEDYVWELADAGAGDAETVHSNLQNLAGTDLGFVKPNPPVVCLDQNFEPTDDFKSPTNALRLRPDHCPAFADAAWMAIEMVQSDPALVALVDPLDQARIGGDD